MNKITRILASSLAAIAISLPAKAEEKRFVEPSRATLGVGYSTSGPGLDLRIDGSMLDIENPHTWMEKTLYDRIMVDGELNLGLHTEPFARVNVNGAALKELYLPLDDGGNLKYANYERGAWEAGFMFGGGSDINLPGTNAGKFFFYTGPRHGFNFIKERGIDVTGSLAGHIGKSGSFSAYADFPVLGVLFVNDGYQGLFGGAVRTRIESAIGKGFGAGAALDVLALGGNDGLILDSALDVFLEHIAKKEAFVDRFIWGVRGKILHSGSFYDTGFSLFIGIKG